LLSNTSDTWQSGLYLKSDASGNPRLTLLAPTGALGEAVSIDSAAKVGIGSTAPTAQLDVYSGAAARVGAVIRGAASQTANLQEWQNSAGALQASVSSAGGFDVNFIRNSTYFLLTYSSAGGNLRLKKSTSTPSSPGADWGVLAFRDGTNAGTLKLVVRAGAAGAETTILDNIPQ
jgi:hypothetical protein